MKILAIRHIAREGAGTLETYLREKGASFHYWDIVASPERAVEPEDYDAYIILGGPMGAYEEDKYPFIRRELAILEKLLGAQKPILGICLGAQLLAKALGARVLKGPWKEIGWYPVMLTEEGKRDSVFRRVASRTPTIGAAERAPRELLVFHWHGDTFDMPRGAGRLASSPLYPNQAFRYGNLAYGLQFHIEMTEMMVHDWVEAGRDELASVQNSVGAEAILRDMPAAMPRLQKTAERFYDAYFANMTVPRKSYAS